VCQHDNRPILLTEIVVYKTLITNVAKIYTDDTFRYERLKLRESEYAAQIIELKKDVDKYYSVSNLRRRNDRHDADWRRAGKLWPELMRCFAGLGIDVPQLESASQEGVGPLLAKPEAKDSSPPAPRRDRGSDRPRP